MFGRGGRHSNILLHSNFYISKEISNQITYPLTSPYPLNCVILYQRERVRKDGLGISNDRLIHR